MGKTLTKTQRAKLARLEAARDKSRQAIYDAAMPRRDVPFSECYRMASEAAQSEHDCAQNNVTAFRYTMIEQGRAYWDQWGTFHAY